MPLFGSEGTFIFFPFSLTEFRQLHQSGQAIPVVGVEFPVLGHSQEIGGIGLVEYVLGQFWINFLGLAQQDLFVDLQCGGDFNDGILGGESMLSEEAANATINRELSALKRMLNLGREQGKVDRVRHISMLAENNIRKGFFEHSEFIALRDALPEYLKDLATFGYRVDWPCERDYRTLLEPCRPATGHCET